MVRKLSTVTRGTPAGPADPDLVLAPARSFSRSPRFGEQRAELTTAQGLERAGRVSKQGGGYPSDSGAFRGRFVGHKRGTRSAWDAGCGSESWPQNAENPRLSGGFLPSADERTRTSTGLLPHGPEPCASTNSATSAWQGAARYLKPAKSALPPAVPSGGPWSPWGNGRDPLGHASRVCARATRASGLPCCRSARLGAAERSAPETGSRRAERSPLLRLTPSCRHRLGD